MTGSRRFNLINALRAELATFSVLCLMILAVPLVLPLGHAFAGGPIICTQQGAVEENRSGVPAGTTLACPCIVSCFSGSNCCALKLVQPANFGFSAAKGGNGWHLENQIEAQGHTQPAGAHGIRAPPALV